MVDAPPPHLADRILRPHQHPGDRHREAALRNNLTDLLRAERTQDAGAIDELKQAVAIFAEIGEPGKLEPEIWKLSEW